MKKREEALKEYLTKQTITEAPTAEEVFGQEEPETARGETISEVLDHCSEEADEFYSSLASRLKKGIKPIGAKETNKFNPLFVGPTGAGKTSIISTWARDNGYDLITLNMMGDALDFLGVKTINRDYDLQIDDEGHTQKVARVSTVATQAFDPFLHGTTKVLFLDEINKTNPRILQALYDLISFHTVQNGDEVMYLPKLLFTVGAMNPSEYGNREQLDPALKARLHIYPVNYDTQGLKEYLLKTLDQIIKDAEENIQELVKNNEPEDSKQLLKWQKIYTKNAGRKDIAEALFADLTKFHWTDAAKIADLNELDPMLVPRTLEGALFNCDGTKADFLKWIRRDCGIDALDMINNILSNYRDKEHIANKVWGQDYSVKEEEPENKVENEITANASAEELADAELQTNMYDKLSKLRK